jgi:hypothetical protein
MAAEIADYRIQNLIAADAAGAMLLIHKSLFYHTSAESQPVNLYNFAQEFLREK